MPGTSQNQDAVYNARPTIRINDQEYAKVTELLLGMAMTEGEGGMSALELRLSNIATGDDHQPSLAFEDDRILKLGARINVYAGEVSAPTEIFRGRITGLEAEYPESGPPELIVLAEDAFQMARMARRTKVWSQTSISKIARQLATDLNLTPKITGLTDTIDLEIQLNESDLAFLRRLLMRHDADMQVVGGELHVSPRKDVSRGDVTLKFSGDDRKLRKAKVTADLAHQITKVTVSGWNYKQGQPVNGSSTGANLKPGSGTTGAQLLHNAIGRDRSEHVGDLAVADQTEAQAIADALFDQRARPFVLIEGTAEGTPALRVGTQLNIQGLGGRFSNTYYVVRACHKFDLDKGYVTDFEAQCPFLGAGGSTQ
jgi:Bacteriophage probable baseplate hub protein